MEFTEESKEVLYSTEAVTDLHPSDVEFLKGAARLNERKRIRLCTHPSIDDTLHEMIIVQSRGCYVRPHRHLRKSESFHAIEGELDIVLFDHEGDVSQVIRLGQENGCAVYYRLGTPTYHTVVPQSEFVVFHETTNGPFRREQTEFAPWSPVENSLGEVERYLSRLGKHIDEWTKEAR